jgi:hypothetical protein
MLFARKLLAPGPQPKHPGKVNPVLDTGPPAEPGAYQNEIIGATLYIQSCPFDFVRRPVENYTQAVFLTLLEITDESSHPRETRFSLQ